MTPRAHRLRSLALGVAMLSAMVLACQPTPGDLRIAWSPVESLNRGLPERIRVYAGADPSIPLRAWYVKIEPHDGGRLAQVTISADDDGVETVSELAARTLARVAINAGFFRTDTEPAQHIGLLLVDRMLLQRPLISVIHEEQRYYVARAALGLMLDGSADVAWVTGHEGVLYEWSEPAQNAPSAPAAEPQMDSLVEWPARDAVAGGPVLVDAGEVRITSHEEVFFGTASNEAHPRSAAGVTATGELIVMVVDGRQRESRGVDLRELAELMRAVGCVEALNLDGGGSSTLVVDGVLVNRPLGSESQREVMSALTVMEP